jgi:hypothetical protein
MERKKCRILTTFNDGKNFVTEKAVAASEDLVEVFQRRISPVDDSIGNVNLCGAGRLEFLDVVSLTDINTRPFPALLTLLGRL